MTDHAHTASDGRGSLPTPTGPRSMSALALADRAQRFVRQIANSERVCCGGCLETFDDVAEIVINAHEIVSEMIAEYGKDENCDETAINGFIEKLGALFQDPAHER
mgnify:FL=1